MSKMAYMTARMNEAYRQSPSGAWWQRFIPGVCKHDRVRCTHGDEIIARRFRRVACLVCGRSLDRDLPEVCFFTGELHSGS
jgi:predicted secreted Zn-dependent protease